MSLKIALLGSGLATAIHSKTLRVIDPRIQRFYASRDGDRAAAAASRFGGAGHFGSYDAALDNPTIDAVIVGLPPALHLEWTLRALAAGKHAIVEKPPFLQSCEFEAVESAARRAGRQVLVAENYFYKPLTGVLRGAIARGDLGRVLFIQLNALKHQSTGNWRDDVRLAGGGALFEGGIHWVSLLANIGMTPVRVSAVFPDASADRRAASVSRGHDAGSARHVERSALVTLEYAEGAVATLAYSWDLPGRVNGVRMSRAYGTAGMLRFETNGVFVAQSGRKRRLTVPGLRDLAGYRGMMRDFVAAIEENRPPKYDLALARRDLQLVEQAYASGHADRIAAHPGYP
jgi:predicted dehydrogenase